MFHAWRPIAEGRESADPSPASHSEVQYLGPDFFSLCSSCSCEGGGSVEPHPTSQWDPALADLAKSQLSIHGRLGLAV